MNLLYVELLANHVQNRLKINDSSHISINREQGKIFIKDVDLATIEQDFWEFNGEILTMASGKVDTNSPLSFYSIQFRNCKFGLIDISTKKISMHFVFIDCTFQNRLIARQTAFLNKLEFEACEFLENVDFGSSCFINEFVFLSNQVKKNFKFLYSSFYRKANFSESSFCGQTAFDRSYFYQDALFSNVVFYEYARFVEIRFCGLANFIGTIFSRTEFVGTSFKQTANFIMATFEEDVIFWLSKFHSVARFSRAIFQKTAVFNDVEFKKYIPHHAEALNYHNNKDSYKFARFVPQIDFSSAMFYDDFEMQRAKINGLINFFNTSFEKNTKWNKTHFFHLPVFKQTIFEASSTWQGVTFEKDVKFDSIYFGGEASFAPSKKENPTTFKAKAIFHNCVFEESDFSRVDFKGIAKFDGVVFKDLTSFYKTDFRKNANFQGSIFGGITSFDGTKFNPSQKPVFLNCTFSNQFNIEHKHLRYEYDDIEKEIENTTQERSNPSLWRDLFRRLKSNRLAHHNIIDASELHTQELYARELELNQKGRGIRDKIEKWQLWFYRLTSDHHTDLAKIFNNVILLIALFGIFACATTLFTQTIEIVKPKINNIPIFALLQTKSYIFSELPKKIPIEIGLVSLAIVNFCGIYSYLELRKVVQEKLFSFKIIDILLVVCIACCLYYRLSEAFFIFFLCFAFVASYILCLQIQKFFITIFSYLVCVGVLILKPTLLLPFVGRFLESSPTASFPAMQSLSVVYCILMFLMLFSLQKTARKNSIIPS